MKHRILAFVSLPTQNQLESIFFASNHRITFVHNIEAFIDATSMEIPDLIIHEMHEIETFIFKSLTLVRKNDKLSTVPLIILSKNNDANFINDVLWLHIYDFIKIPIHSQLLGMKITNALLANRSIKAYDYLLTDTNKEMHEVQSVLIDSLATLAEYRDPETGEHIKRTQNYVKALAQALVKSGHYLDELTESNIDLIFQSVPLHDIGKVGIRDDILLKPGKLNDEEFAIMKTHARLGYQAILKTQNKIANNAFLKFATDVAYTHHEKFDGSGYPRGLKGEEIPLVGRLMAIADVYDALISKRVYKEALSHEEALEIIKNGSGSHFDPLLVKTFLEIESSFRNIAETYMDTHEKNQLPSELITYFNEGLIKNILIVDDSKIIRSILKNQLMTIGFHVDEAQDGLKAYEKTKKIKYDLIISDIEMPRRNGYDFIKLAKETQNKDAIFILMTAQDYTNTLDKIKALHIDGLLLKPIELNRLESKLRQIYVDKKRKRDNRINLDSATKNVY